MTDRYTMPRSAQHSELRNAMMRDAMPINPFPSDNAYTTAMRLSSDALLGAILLYYSERGV